MRPDDLKGFIKRPRLAKIQSAISVFLGPNKGIRSFFVVWNLEKTYKMCLGLRIRKKLTSSKQAAAR